MDNSGQRTIAAFNIAAAGSQVSDWITGLDGMSELDVQFNFKYGSGGTKTQVWLQTSLDGGQTPIDLYCMSATQASKVRALRIKPDGVVNTPTDGALADDTLVTGVVLGDRLRAKMVSTGIYAGSTTLGVSACAR